MYQATAFKPLRVLVITFFFSIHCIGQNITLRWAHSYGSTIFDNASVIVANSAGEVYVSGQFGGTIDFDPGPGVFNMSSTTGGPDVYLSKFDVNGNFIWAKQVQGPGAGTFALVLDNTGNIYFSGVGNGLPFISKVDPNGNFLWTAQFVNLTNKIAIDIDNSGNLYATGTFSGVNDFDPGPGVYNLTASTQSEFVLKLNSSGNFVWVFSIDCTGSNPNPGRSIVVGQSGDIYISGFMAQAADFDPSSSILTLSANPGIFIAKYTSNGNLVWGRSINNNIYNYGIAKDGNENIFLTGSFLGSIDFDTGPGSYNLSAGSGRDSYVLKLDAGGNFVWVKQITGGSDNWGYSITTDNLGNIYSTGFFGGTTDFDPSAAFYNLGTVGSVSYDIYIWKLDNSGNFIWAIPFGSMNYDVGMCVALDASRNVYSSGSFAGTMDCDPGPGVLNLNMVDFGDAYFLKLSQCVNVSFSTINTSACFSYTLNNHNYTSSGIYTQVLQNSGGCDSIITLNLTINGSNDTTNVSACDSYTWNGQVYTVDGFYRDTLTGTYGCDSIINLSLTIKQSTSSVIPITICEGQNYNGYTTSGIYVDSYTASNGCDSIRTLNLTVLSRSYSSLNTVICQGQNYLGYSQTGVYRDTLIAVNGCDSIRTVNLHVNPVAITNRSVDICEGQSFWVAGVNQTVPGTYRDTLQTYLGCDSIIVTNLLLHAKPKPNLGPDKDLCAGDLMSLNPGIFNSYLWQDQTILSTYTTDSTGSYWVTVTDNNGCTASDTMQIISMLTVPKDFLPGDTSICNYGSVLLKSTGTFKNYLWSTNSMNQNITIQNAGEYWLKVTDNNNCKGSDTIVVSPKECLKGFFIPTAFTPNGDGKNDHLKPLLFGNVKKYHFVIYNRWGEIVFETSDLTKGWDGTVKGMKQESAVYVWLCNYQFEGEELRIQKGTVLLIQ